MKDDFMGSEILRLLIILDIRELDKSIRFYYSEASQSMIDDPKSAVKRCKSALAVLSKNAKIQLGNPEARTHARGRVYLLMGSIYLNELPQTDLKQSEEWFEKSMELFHQIQYIHLESLAYLALAISRRKLGKYEFASDACENAQILANYDSIPTEIGTRNLDRLRVAIQEERKKIQNFSLRETRPLLPKPEHEPEVESETECEDGLPVFPISVGTEFVAQGGTTDLNFLSREDYHRHIKDTVWVKKTDLDKWLKGNAIDYILKIDDGIKFVDNDLKSAGTWLFIKTETDPEKLKGKIVACVAKKRGKLSASLKVFSSTDDHYFLKAKRTGVASIIVIHYSTRDYSKIADYYKKFGTIEENFVYDVRISGEVVGWLNHPPASAFIWNLPIVDNIAAGYGQIAERDIVDYVNLSDTRYPNVDFGVDVIGDSMEGVGIFEGDIALIHTQTEVENGEIAAVVIETSAGKKIGVLKQYFEVDNTNDELRHWALKSGNPNRKNLVVIPVGSNEIAIKSRYDNLANAGKINLPKYFTSASVVIAGKYVGSIKSG